LTVFKLGFDFFDGGQTAFKLFGKKAGQLIFAPLLVLSPTNLYCAFVGVAPLLVLSPTNLYSRQQTCAFVGVVTNKLVFAPTNLRLCWCCHQQTFHQQTCIRANKLVFAPTNLKLRHLRLCWCLRLCAFVGVVTNKLVFYAFVGVITNKPCANKLVFAPTNLKFCAFVGVITNKAFTNKLVFAPTNLKFNNLPYNEPKSQNHLAQFRKTDRMNTNNLADVSSNSIFLARDYCGYKSAFALQLFYQINLY